MFFNETPLRAYKNYCLEITWSHKHNKNYSFLVEEHEINSKLFPLIKSIHKDKDLLNQMKNKQKIHSDQLVFKKINDEIKKFIND